MVTPYRTSVTGALAVGGGGGSLMLSEPRMNAGSRTSQNKAMRRNMREGLISEPSLWMADLWRVKRSAGRCQFTAQVGEHFVHVLFGSGFDEAAGDGGQHASDFHLAGIGDHGCGRRRIGDFGIAEFHPAASLHEAHAGLHARAERVAVKWIEFGERDIAGERTANGAHTGAHLRNIVILAGGL